MADEEIKKDEKVGDDSTKKKADDKKTPTTTPLKAEPVAEPTISLAAFLNMFELQRHIRFKYERLFRFQATELHTYKEWSDTTGLGKEEVKK